MREPRREWNAKNMKKASKRTPKAEADEPRAEYRLDYSKSRPNRFAKGIPAGGRGVILEPDVAAVFDSSESVNRFLRSAIEAFHEGAQKPPAAKRKAS